MAIEQDIKLIEQVTQPFVVKTKAFVELVHGAQRTFKTIRPPCRKPVKNSKASKKEICNASTWLIGIAAVTAVTAVVKAVSDDSPSSSSSTTTYDDSDRRQQEQEAKRQHERENLKARVQSLAGERREHLKAELRSRLGAGILIGQTQSCIRRLEQNDQIDARWRDG